MNEPQTPERSQRRTFIGIVTSDKMDRTITVQVDRLVQHPVFKKYVRKTSSFKVHDDKEDAKTGDRVEIAECRPISKTKRFRLIRVLDRAVPTVNVPAASEPARAEAGS